MLDSLNWGGAQMMQLFLVETLQPLGIDITVISLRASSNSPMEDKLKAAGAKVVSYPFPQLVSPGSFLGLVQFLQKERFDLLHTYLTYSNIIGPLAGLASQTPVIASLRNADFDYKNYSKPREFIERLTMRHLAKSVMANGNVVGEFAHKRLGKQAAIDIIPNAVETFPPLPDAERRAFRTELIGNPDRLVVLSVGRLTEQKGFPDLFEAFARVQVEYPDAALMIAGAGKLQEQFQQQIHSLGLDGHVFLLGLRNDARRLMAAADLYVNSSHWEGTPVSVLEAMATGLPIIATNVGENPYLLADGAGMIVPARQPDELAGALKILLGSTEKRAEYSRAALRRVENHYSRAAWRNSLLSLYARTTPAAIPYLKKLDGIS
jgi:glycosyltransferase involved in cell wall biosynthesis